jgi:hypothetical protein
LIGSFVSMSSPHNSERSPDAPISDYAPKWKGWRWWFEASGGCIVAGALGVVIGLLITGAFPNGWKCQSKNLVVFVELLHCRSSPRWLAAVVCRDEPEQRPYTPPLALATLNAASDTQLHILAESLVCGDTSP